MPLPQPPHRGAVPDLTERRPAGVPTASSPSWSTQHAVTRPSCSTTGPPRHGSRHRVRRVPCVSTGMRCTRSTTPVKRAANREAAASVSGATTIDTSTAVRAPRASRAASKRSIPRSTRSSETPRTASCVRASPSTETVTRSTPASNSSFTRRSSRSVPFVVTNVRAPARRARRASSPKRGWRRGSPHWKSRTKSSGRARRNTRSKRLGSMSPRGRVIRPFPVGQNVHFRLQRFVTSRFADTRNGAGVRPSRYATSLATPATTVRRLR